MKYIWILFAVILLGCSGAAQDSEDKLSSEDSLKIETEIQDLEESVETIEKETQEIENEVEELLKELN